MYYLWKNKESGIYYITDYKEVTKGGLIKIDGQGFIDVELVFSHKIKMEVIAFAQKESLR